MEVEYFDPTKSVETSVRTEFVDLASEEASETPPADIGKPVEPEKPSKGPTKKDITSKEVKILEDEDLPEIGEITEEEPKELPEEPESKRKTPSRSKGDSSSSSPYSVLARTLAEEGVLSSFDENEFNELSEELGSPGQALVELTKRTIDEGIEGYKNSLTPEQKQYLEALDAGVPHETFTNLQAKAVQFDKLSDEDVENNDELARTLLKHELKLRGYDDEEIEETVKDTDSVGKLKSRGKKSLGVLKKYYETAKQKEIAAAKADREARVKAINDNINKLKSTIDSINEIIPGQKLANKDRQKIFEAITKPIAEDKERGVTYNLIAKKRLDNPIDFDIKLAHLILTGAFDGNMKSIQRTAKTKAIEELDSILNGKPITAGLSGGAAARSKLSPAAKETVESLERTFGNARRTPDTLIP